ncbi:MAG: hypothetical protein WCJ66_07475 [Verrucomicrobiota bacterium]
MIIPAEFGDSGIILGLVLNPSSSNEVYPFNDGSSKSDLGVKRFVQLAKERGIPVLGEFDHTFCKPLYLMEDFFPRLMYGELAGWEEMEGIVDVKEYHGFVPSTFSVNAAMLKAWMKSPDAPLDKLLWEIAGPYGPNAALLMIKAWAYVAQHVEAYPWDVSWILTSEKRGQKQTAYQVLVATTPDLLAKDQGDLWDSGKVVTDQSIQVEYVGRPLKSRMRCFWKVRVWDVDMNLSAWSEPALWTIGLLNPNEWETAKWVGEEKRAPGYDSEAYQWIWYPEGKLNQVAPAGTRYVAVDSGTYSFSVTGGGK